MNTVLLCHHQLAIPPGCSFLNVISKWEFIYFFSPKEPTSPRLWDQGRFPGAMPDLGIQSGGQSLQLCCKCNICLGQTGDLF